MLQKNRCYSMKTNLWDTDKQGQIIIECISFKNKNHSWDTVWQTRADYRIHKFKKKHGWDRIWQTRADYWMHRFKNQQGCRISNMLIIPCISDIKKVWDKNILSVSMAINK